MGYKIEVPFRSVNTMTVVNGHLGAGTLALDVISLNEFKVNGEIQFLREANRYWDKRQLALLLEKRAANLFVAATRNGQNRTYGEAAGFAVASREAEAIAKMIMNGEIKTSV